MAESNTTTVNFWRIPPFCFKFILVLLFLTCSNIRAQSTYGDYLSSNVHNLADEIIKPSVQSPDVAAFQKNNFLPTTKFTGRANISIPIYTIDYGGMKVPISISYNTSGVKVADMSSRVGLNWSLNAGGVVSRVIQGLDDFTQPIYFDPEIGMKSPAGWLASLHPNFETRGDNNSNDDAMPDRYIVRAPGLETEFVPKSNGVIMDLRRSGNIFNPAFDMIQRNYISYLGNPVTSFKLGLKSLQVTNLEGIRYDFETPDLTNGRNSRSDAPANHLDQMINLNTNQIITFEYESFSNHYADETKLNVTSYGGGTHGFSDKTVNNWFNLGNRLTKIDFQTGSVEFIYGHDRQDYPGEKALTQVKVKDAHGKVIKDFRLSHSYFQSGIETGTPESQRLRLDAIYELDNYQNPKPGHDFTYNINNNYDMPPRDSYAYDYLGYNNGSYSSNNSNPSPKMYFYDHKITPLYRSTAIELPGNFSMAANPNYAKTYSLIKIDLPTGGSQEFDYELNQFGYKGQTISGGGLRLKTQYLKAGDGSEQILDYEYSQGTIGLMPSYASYYMKTDQFSYPSNLSELTTQLGIDTFSSPNTQIELINGSFVGYRSVSELQRNGHGKTTYAYGLTVNSPSTKTFPPGFSIGIRSNHWLNLNEGLLFIDNDFMRGRLTSKTVFDSNDRILQLTRNFYELQERGPNLVNLEFYNIIHNSCSYIDGHLRSPSENLNLCGGFKEVVNLRPSRYILKSVRSTDYALDGEDPSIQNETQGIFVEKKYIYDPHFPLITTEFISNYESDEYFGTSSDHQNAIWESRKDIIYPVSGSQSEYSSPQVNSYPYAQELYNQNRIASPMEVEISGRSYSKQLFDYTDFGGGLIDIKKISTVLRDNVAAPTGEVISRNGDGRPTEIQQPGGKILSIIYGYQGSEIIALVDGEDYSSINSWLNTDYGKSLSYLNQVSDLDFNASTESILQTWLQNLRSSVENRSGNTTTVRTFTYDPLVGTTSITDERGITTTYVYDQLDRLQSIKNDDSHIMKYFNYNYRN